MYVCEGAGRCSPLHNGWITREAIDSKVSACLMKALNNPRYLACTKVCKDNDRNPFDRDRRVELPVDHSPRSIGGLDGGTLVLKFGGKKDSPLDLNWLGSHINPEGL